MSSKAIPTSLDAVQIAAFSLQESKYPSIQVQSTALRISIIEKLGIKPGSKVLEVGCGQGDTTAVLAVAVGEGGRVVAVDPGPPDYGKPITIGEAQAHFLAGPLGSRINFIRATPIEHINSLSKNADYEYDYAILSLCTFYFSSPTTLRETFKAISTKCKEIFVAEWALVPSSGFTLESYPHVLAVFARASLDSQTSKPTSNCRNLLSPKALKEMMTSGELGLKCIEERLFDPPETNLEGMWEVDMVLNERFEGNIRTTFNEIDADGNEEGKERGAAVILGLRDAIRASLPENGAKGVKSMSVWCAKFARG